MADQPFHQLPQEKPTLLGVVHSPPIAAERGPGWVQETLPSLLDWLAEPYITAAPDNTRPIGLYDIAPVGQTSRRQAGVGFSYGARSEIEGAGRWSDREGGLGLAPRALSFPLLLQPRLRQLLEALSRCPKLYDGLDEHRRRLLRHLRAVLPRELVSNAAGIPAVCTSSTAHGIASVQAEHHRYGRGAHHTPEQRVSGSVAAWIRAALSASRMRFSRSSAPLQPRPQGPISAAATAPPPPATGAAVALPQEDVTTTSGRPFGSRGRSEPQVAKRRGLGEGANGPPRDGVFGSSRDRGGAGNDGDAGANANVDDGAEDGGEVSVVGDSGWWWISDLNPSNSKRIYLPDDPDPEDPSDPDPDRDPEPDTLVVLMPAVLEAPETLRKDEDADKKAETSKAEDRIMQTGPIASGTTAARQCMAATDITSPPGKRRRKDYAEVPAVSAAPRPHAGEDIAGDGGGCREPYGTAGSAASIAEILRDLQDAVSSGCCGGQDAPPETWLRLESRLEQAAGLWGSRLSGGSSSSAASAEAETTPTALPADTVLHIVRQLVTPRLSGAAARLLLGTAMLPAVVAVERVMPRALQEAMAAAAGPHPRSLAESVLIPAVQRPDLTASQAQLLLKTATGGPHPLPWPLQALVLRAAAVAGANWCDSHLAVVQGLLDAVQGGLDPDTLGLLCQGLYYAVHGSQQQQHEQNQKQQQRPMNRSVPFCRLLLSVLTKYGSTLDAVQLRQLQETTNGTSTFLTKPCLAKLQELTGSRV
ncbi:hypothetical protein Vretimale_8588 [Volvox reticuliferus]|uniref:Fanconi Anaemia group E protein C-terminal domain-containing protein n=1 Tax=Volvox reticuliferus TaxID=1737510 RepID=A0A8J4LNU8_9CHLO|nr:hypothetical protein Vretifemale_6501 [Volvox reticuliferus]GIM03938.1 hypothetical protein Vretimale_8588 [Volvox reticuliferus]